VILAGGYRTSLNSCGVMDFCSLPSAAYIIVIIIAFVCIALLSSMWSNVITIIMCIAWMSAMWSDICFMMITHCWYSFKDVCKVNWLVLVGALTEGQVCVNS